MKLKTKRHDSGIYDVTTPDGVVHRVVKVDGNGAAWMFEGPVYGYSGFSYVEGGRSLPRLMDVKSFLSDAYVVATAGGVVSNDFGKWRY